MREDKIVSVAGIGDKSSDYTVSDLTTVSKMVDMAWDIVENKRIEAELKESQMIFNAFIENSPIYVFFKDKHYRTKHLSRNYEQLLGRPLSQLLNKSNAEIFPAEEADRVSAIDFRAMEAGQTIVTEEEFGGRYFTNIRFPIFKDDKPEYLAVFPLT
jgi:PAS domain S-box-containing protein